MKLKVLNREEGVLKVFVGAGKFENIDVPLSNIEEWYPFSNAYEYKYRKYQKVLELKRLRSTLPQAYDVGSNSKSDVRHPDRVCRVEEMYNKTVHRDNLRIIEKAKSYDIPTITDDFTAEDVEKGFFKLGIIFEDLIKIVIDKYLEGKEPAEVAEFLLKSESLQLAEAFAEEDDKVTLTYNELGQIYSMLTVMKKITRRE